MPTRRSASSRLVLALSLLFAALPAADAAEFLGAEVALRRLAATADTPAPDSTDEIAQLKRALETYRRDAATLAPDAAAAGWLSLFDQLVRLPAEKLHRQPYHDRLSVGSLVEALPPPAAWDALAAAIRTRTEKTNAPRELGLRILGAILSGRGTEQNAALVRLRAAIKADKKLESYQAEQLRETADTLAAAITSASGDSARLAAFERELKQLETPGSARVRYGGASLAVPDLVRFAGRAAAEPLLVRALRLDAELHLWSAGESTRRALSELALLHVDRLKRPRWDLVTSLQDVALYEALARKFPAKSADDDHERRSATVVYLLGLIAADRVDDATALVFNPETRFDRSGVSFGYGSNNLFTQLQRAGRGDATFDFLRQALTRDPALPFWDAFITVSAQQSRAGDALALLRATLAKPDLPADEAASLRSRYVTALLAADELDEGLQILRAQIAEGRRAAAAPAADDTASAATSVTASFTPSLADLQAAGIELTADIVALLEAGAGSLASGGAHDLRGDQSSRITRLLKLGRLLEKPELIEEGLAAGRELLPRLGERESYAADDLVTHLVETLERLGRATEAEALLLEQLTRLVREEKEPRRMRTQTALIRLAGLYSRAGRHEDVLRLFTGSPDLGAADLSELPIQSYGSDTGSAHLLIADALAATGRAAEARRILIRVAQNRPGHDPAYERLEKLGGPDHAALLDELARIDRFEERPLIWKARLLLAAGDLAAAERTIRDAIAIDPSDGEQPKGDRMRAYAVLGDILERRGDAEQAAFMRGAVAAIRLSEQADDWWSAGLLTRAVRLYEKSLHAFADAYCIQSRLALRYNELGDFAKAEEHYRRAFELMPDSFGRVESHCFGCEGAFDGPRAQNIADKVFTRLAEEPSPRAQVFYLLGYLRASQERPADAAENFRKALALDPDYLNAWVKLQNLADEFHLPAAEREAAALAILRLDPEGRRARPDLTGFTDLRTLWGALLAAEASLPPPETGPLFAFPAAKERLESERKSAGSFMGGFHVRMQERRRNLREHLTRNELFSATSQIIEQTLRR